MARHVVGGADGELSIWRTSDWECLLRMKGHRAAVLGASLASCRVLNIACQRYFICVPITPIVAMYDLLNSSKHPLVSGLIRYRNTSEWTPCSFSWRWQEDDAVESHHRHFEAQ